MNAPELPKSFERRETELPNPLPRPEGEFEALKKAWEPPRLAQLHHGRQQHLCRPVVCRARRFLFFMLAGILALIMRTQLAVPENDLVSHDLYNQLFTMHGTVMMFLFAVPAVEAASVYLLPNMQARARPAVPAPVGLCVLGLFRRRPGLLLHDLLRPGAGWRLVHVSAAHQHQVLAGR